VTEMVALWDASRSRQYRNADIPDAVREPTRALMSHNRLLRRYEPVPRDAFRTSSLFPVPNLADAPGIREGVCRVGLGTGSAVLCCQSRYEDLTCTQQPDGL
jgi:hypothetical protein